MPNKSLSETLRACRVCDSSKVDQILDLGTQPPANSLRKSLDEVLPRIPLILCRCLACGTVQITETVSPAYLFQNYVWVTGASETARRYAELFCDRMIERCPKTPRFVLEIASNDGTFLKSFQKRGDTVLGVDPSKNIAKIARCAGVPTISEFFNLRTARDIAAIKGCADVVFARNVIPHAANAHEIMAGIKHCLSDDGVGAIEFHCADVILTGLHYDSIYHEHLCYHSLHSMNVLLNQFDLNIFDITDSPISGGSLVVYFSKKPRLLKVICATKVKHEHDLGVNEKETWMRFAERCKDHRRLLCEEVMERADKRMIGYGASARGATLINFCDISLGVIADSSTMKHGLYAPSDVEIVPPEKAFALKPDVMLLLAWNFKDEIIAEIKAKKKWRGEIIVPLPEITCISL